ncbi:hypothetical protein VC83_01983 [Pseudogymnoascus destructans]|uniref:DUF2415 domain-containing protein n=2 Tax=Pseudogymnoascus destructans TaxID=655981 RepID=L8FU96_PSED2|nr:uncharacterized protein VC83_01983 [Pseudogymnoascus destructans]ELR04467.1 hypothetical protein GMDG_06773 [Pseudogymnoascus destructans 20631-21]OAF61673.1 hypothetical protein VC83_01983 [Pseudogymnoascus destructans]
MAAMAVKYDSLYLATDNLILPCPRKQYRAFMFAGHWQLRSFVHSPSLGKIHYLGVRDIYEIDTSKQTRRIVDTLSFKPKCLVSSNGWICCGGEKGRFTALHLDSNEGGVGPPSEADARLPLDLDPFRRLHLSLQNRDSRPGAGADANRNRSQMRIIGDEILNCITLWFPRSDVAEGAYTKPVAVVASNDLSAYIVDLKTLEIIESVEQVDPVNLGRISPDGSVLIVVGDDPYMHVYKRSLESGSRKDEDDYSWSKCHAVQLPGQRIGDEGDMRGSFAGDFSDRYLAVGTQHGMVVVYETAHLIRPEKPRPIVTFPTTRPNTKHGAVRSLQFSPSSPYDLLAVTEDGGRVIVADVRSLNTRQVIDVGESVEGFELVTLTESTGDNAIDPRLQADLDARGDDSTDFFDSFLDSGQRRAAPQLINHGTHQLTRDETAVLEALQIERRRRERETNPTASNNPWNSVADELRARTRTGERRSPNINLPGPLRDLLSSRNTDSLRALVLERNQDREQRGLPPRRRGVLTAARSALDPEPRDPTRLPDNQPIDDAPPRISLHLPSSLSIHSSPSSAEVDAIYSMAMDSQDPSARLQLGVDDEVRRETIRQADELASTRRRQNEPWTSSPVQARYSGQRDPPEENQTTGCSWSRDSRTLYVGTEGSMYEFPVNITNRKIFPSIKWR